jgi:hypothetical protein
MHLLEDFFFQHTASLGKSSLRNAVVNLTLPTPPNESINQSMDQSIYPTKQDKQNGTVDNWLDSWGATHMNKRNGELLCKIPLGV